MADAADDEAVERPADAEHHERQQRQGEQRIEMQLRGEQPGAEHRDHQQRAMREVDDVQHAVDQRQPECHERIDATGQQSADERGEQDVEHQPTSSAAARPAIAPYAIAVSSPLPER